MNPNPSHMNPPTTNSNTNLAAPVPKSPSPKLLDNIQNGNSTPSAATNTSQDGQNQDQNQKTNQNRGPNQRSKKRNGKQNFNNYQQQVQNLPLENPLNHTESVPNKPMQTQPQTQQPQTQQPQQHKIKKSSRNLNTATPPPAIISPALDNHPPAPPSTPVPGHELNQNHHLGSNGTFQNQPHGQHPQQPQQPQQPLPQPQPIPPQQQQTNMRQTQGQMMGYFPPYPFGIIPFPSQIPPENVPTDQGRNVIYTWNTEKVCSWLSSKGFAEYAHNFRDNHIDGSTLLDIKENQLKEDLHIKSLGHRIKLWKYICNITREIKQ